MDGSRRRCAFNGGPESVYAFLDELNRRKVRADADYECARFIAIVAKFFDKEAYTSLSLGVTNGPASIPLGPWLTSIKAIMAFTWSTAPRVDLLFGDLAQFPVRINSARGRWRRKTSRGKRSPLGDKAFSNRKTASAQRSIEENRSKADNAGSSISRRLVALDRATFDGVRSSGIAKPQLVFHADSSCRRTAKPEAYSSRSRQRCVPPVSKPG